MQTIKEFFIKIDRADIDESMRNLVSNNEIDSIDVMALVAEIEKHYQKTLDRKYIKMTYFEDFESIKKMLDEAYRS
ncbi:acyl carrier protein [Campylobacter upsaliensis]|nr:acyl carrier protein [Campylobacter upsaliensis]EAH6029786.1 acyl carrier protein [Campylobacter upsaliensis]EAJ0413086.1 acyl carrier protein [Campylobacter upsaliensis]EAJ7098441.1 acyl carrier protein [Campylobacter upsaliensis]EAK3667462.1 acyl carrier protein [Campylobacter upsaliensis]